MPDDRCNTAVIRVACAITDPIIGQRPPEPSPGDLQRLRASVLLTLLAALVTVVYGVRQVTTGYMTLAPTYCIALALLAASLLLIHVHRSGPLAVAVLGTIVLWEMTAAVRATGNLGAVLHWWGVMPCGLALLLGRPLHVALWATVCTLAFFGQVYLSERHADLRSPYLAAATVMLTYGAISVAFSATRARYERDIQRAEKEIETLVKLVPICAYCKQIRDDQGYWHGVEEYLREHAGADLTHSICPACYAKEMERLRAEAPSRVDTPAT